MRKQIGSKKLLLLFLTAAVLVLAGLAAKRAYDNHRLTQRLLAEEIYMFQNTYMFHKFDAGDSILYAYYMVCEPVDDKVQLVEKLERLMEEKQVVQGVKDYYREKFGEKFGYENLVISVKFYKPSKEFPIGWQPLESYSMEDYPEMSKNLVLSINIPWNAKTQDEHTYDFWRLMTSVGMMTFDVFTRQTQADGSFILISRP